VTSDALRLLILAILENAQPLPKAPLNMKPTIPTLLLAATTLFCTAHLASAQKKTGKLQVGKPAPADLSLRNEVEHAVSKGAMWLAKQQKPGGHWGEPDYPAMTALAVSSLLNQPGAKLEAQIKKGLDFLVANVKPDGGIYNKGMSAYNTSLGMMTLMQSGDPAYKPIVLNARNFLVRHQTDIDKPGEADNAFDGGLGYTPDRGYADLSNTYLALEALYYSEQYLKNSPEHQLKMDLNWKMAIEFISKCQNRPESNPMEFAKNAPEADRGGFVYFPGQSKAGEKEQPDGKVALRSYGSMSYAGLLSFIYADMERDDPRIKAVREWLGKNYSTKENPGMGQEGLFYYYHTMGKALSILEEDTLVLPDGKKANWRADLVKRLFDLQDPQGFWLNENGRWWEKDPVLVTSYALLTLERLHSSL
jgi:squalene-hopene/tetraprenyl-beta-curcumene cyclase